jgi:hypothetical protein
VCYVGNISDEAEYENGPRYLRPPSSSAPIGKNKTSSQQQFYCYIYDFTFEITIKPTANQSGWLVYDGYFLLPLETEVVSSRLSRRMNMYLYFILVFVLPRLQNRPS